MFQPEDICIVRKEAVSLPHIYHSLIGKQVVIKDGEVIHDRYPVRVLHPSPEHPLEWSSQIRIMEDLLVKES